MSTGTQRATARDLQRRAKAVPLARATPGPADRGFFAKIDRELTWGLTLNK